MMLQPRCPQDTLFFILFFFFSFNSPNETTDLAVLSNQLNELDVIKSCESVVLLGDTHRFFSGIETFSATW